MKKIGFIPLLIVLVCAYGAYQLSAYKVDVLYHADGVRIYNNSLVLVKSASLFNSSMENYRVKLSEEGFAAVASAQLLNSLENVSNSVAYFQLNAERRGVDDETRQIIDDYTAFLETLYEAVEKQTFKVHDDFDAIERVEADINTLFEAALFTKEDPGLKTLSDKWNALSLNFRKP